MQIDNKTRCTHYHGELDIISIKFRCCNTFYPCYQCHNEVESHEITVWPKEEFDEDAIHCGNCKNLLSINQYMNCESICPICKAAFNPKCSNHYHLYFEI